MKTIVKFIKKAAKAYFRLSAQNYMWMSTGTFPRGVYDRMGRQQ